MLRIGTFGRVARTVCRNSYTLIKTEIGGFSVRKGLLIVSLFLIAGLILSSCSSIKMSTKDVIEDLVLTLNFDDLLMEESDNDLVNRDEGQVNSMAVSDVYATYTREKTEKTCVFVVLAEGESTGSAQVEVVIPGQVELFTDKERTKLIGIKDATLRGVANYEVAKDETGKWYVVSKKMELKTNDSAPQFGDVLQTPNPAIPAQDMYLKVAVFNDDQDTFRVSARSRSGTSRLRLVDTGSEFFDDVTAGDGIYSGKIPIRDSAEAGEYFGTLKAVSTESVLDTTTDGEGNFTVPVKMAIKSFTVVVGAIE